MSDAGQVTVELEARRGPWDIGLHYRPLDGWLYNGDAPGPQIGARLGDTLVVRLTNALPRPTSLALSGGASTPCASESHPGVLEHPMVQPRETIEFTFTLTRAGTFWYHAAGDAMQIERGLHGVLIVRPPAGLPGMRERVIVLDDVCLGRRATPERRLRDCCMGNVLLMNGRVQPQLVMRAATVEHWRVVNVAHARPVRFSLGGAPFRHMDDGCPAPGDHLRTTKDVEEAMLDPGATADLLVGPFKAGTRLHLQSLPHVAPSESRKLASVFGTVLIGA